MINFIIIVPVLALFLFVGILFYKLTDVNWYHQFFTQDFKDKDFFTKLIKFLMS